jgi:hypothetical protein
VYRISSFFSVLLCFVSAVVADVAALPPGVAIEPEVPGWVEAIHPDYHKVVPDGGVANGVYYLLTDQQVYTEQAALYGHYAFRLTSASGVEENSSISITIDPDYQQLIWHKIDIVRDGIRIDQLANQEFRSSVSQNSDDLIYDNSLDCLAIIPGTKKGDVIEYAYSIVGRNPVEQGRYSRWFSLDYSVPIARIFIRVVCDPGSPPLQFRLLPIDTLEYALPQASLEHGRINYRFQLKDVAPVHVDENVPNDCFAYSYLQVSDWSSWKEVSEWGIKLYHYQDVDVVLPTELGIALQQWQRLEDDKAKALAALRWVQEEIRYVGIMIGPHNFKPYRIEQTLERGFGDCKDKTQLLCFLLDQLGISAIPTLVNSSEKGLILEYEPTPSSFDHVITQVQIDGQTYWLDPTNSSQGGTLDTIWHPNYVAGLPLSMDTTSLVAVPGQGAEESRSYVRETFSMKDYNADIDFVVYSRYSGAEADAQRRYLNRTIRSEAEKNFLNYYAQQFPEIALSAPLEYSDDQEQNIVEIIEHYTISNGWIQDEEDPLLSYLYTYPNLIESSLFVSNTRIRSLPSAQSYPLDFTQVIEIVLPEPGDFSDEDQRIDTPWFEYSKSIETEENKLILTYAYQNLVPRILAEDYAEYAKQSEAVSDSLGYVISYYDSDEDIIIDEDQPYVAHFATFLSAAFFTLLGVLIAAWLVTRKKAPPRPPLYSDLDGLGGWLILPILGICIAPLILIYGIIDQVQYFNTSWIQNFSLPSSYSYIPGFELLVLSEVGFNFFCLVLSVAMLYVLFKKRAILPLFYICFSIFMAFGICLDLAITDYLFVQAGFDGVDDFSGAIRTVTGTVVWGLYFMTSDRVRSTFRN